MYPMGFFASNTTTGAIIAETTGEILTGEVVLTGDTTGAELLTIATGTTIDSGHGSATDENFQDINNLLDTS
jgi:hypothetical protein